MFIEDFGMKISRSEELLQKISINYLADTMSERLPPKEFWSRSETDIRILKKQTEELRDTMLMLNPEKAVTIKKQSLKILHLLESCEEALLQDKILADVVLAVQHLRRAVVESTVFLELANGIKKKPSESIEAVLRLEEVQEAKKYLSNVTVSQTVFARFENLKRSMDSLRDRSISLEKELEEVRKQMNIVQEEISKFEQTSEAPIKKAEPSSSSEPSLVAGDKAEG